MKIHSEEFVEIREMLRQQAAQRGLTLNDIIAEYYAEILGVGTADRYAKRYAEISRLLLKYAEKENVSAHESAARFLEFCGEKTEGQ